MAEGFKIPGLGDYTDSEDELSDPKRRTEPLKEKHFIAIDSDELALKLATAPLNIPDSRLLYKGIAPLVVLTEDQVLNMGHVIEDKDVDYDKDDYLHCDRCDKFYTGLCKEHPLFLVTDRKKDGKELPPCENRAIQTKPLFVDVKTSKIPGAGKGCFVTQDVPRGFVFGPYQGVLRDRAEDAEKDGYCWEIKNSDYSGYLDASYETHSNWMRYINHSHSEEEQNVLAFQYLGSVYYRVVKGILQDEEILVYYGENFDRELLNGSHRAVNTIQRRRPKTKKNSLAAMSRNPFIL